MLLQAGGRDAVCGGAAGLGPLSSPARLSCCGAGPGRGVLGRMPWCLKGVQSACQCESSLPCCQSVRESHCLSLPGTGQAPKGPKLTSSRGPGLSIALCAAGPEAGLSCQAPLESPLPLPTVSDTETQTVCGMEFGGFWGHVGVGTYGPYLGLPQQACSDLLLHTGHLQKILL